MALSKPLFSDVMTQALGLQAFFERFGDAVLVKLRPKQDEPCKGYFPGGSVCSLFGKEFKAWSRGFTRYNNQKRFLNTILEKLNSNRAIPLTIDDVIVTARGGRDAGGSSWIHPLLLTHFLHWCCPEFEAEVAIVFHKYITGDIAESIEFRNRIQELESESVQSNPIDRLEVMRKQIESDDKLCRELKLQSDDLQTKFDQRNADAIRLAATIETMKIQHADEFERYQNEIKERARKAAAEIARLESENDRLESENDEMEEQLDGDCGRPLNVFKNADLPPSEINRDNTRAYWVSAYRVFNDMAIILACWNSDQFELSIRSLINRRLRTRRACNRAYLKLDRITRGEIKSQMRNLLAEELDFIFNIDTSSLHFHLGHALNKVTLSCLIYKRIKMAYDLKYATKLDAKYVAEMVRRFNFYFGDEFKLSYDSDYDVENVDSEHEDDTDDDEDEEEDEDVVLLRA